MNKRAFTLVELLAVIVILSLLALLTSTAITKLVKDSKQDLYDTQIELIKSAAQTWGAENINKLPSSGECSYLHLEYLQAYGLLESNITNPNTNKKMENLVIKITTNDNAFGNPITTYEVNPTNTDNCEPIYICTKVNQSNKGTYELGDEYTCEVKKGVSYTFYILSLDNDKVNLIMDRNLGNSAWITIDDYKNAGGAYNENCLDSAPCAKTDKGPVTAINTLNSLTQSWDKVPNLNETYSNKENYTIKLTGKARLPKVEEIALYPYYNPSLDGYKGIVCNNSSNYWLMNAENVNGARYVYDKNSSTCDNKPVKVIDVHGIRPVITIPKVELG